MRSIGLVLASVLVTLSLAHVSAQTPPPPPPGLTISPSAGDLNTSHLVKGTNFATNATMLAALFDPDGNEIVIHPQTDSAGAFSVPLDPGTYSWRVGLYRFVIALPNGSALGATFIASDGQQHLFAKPYLPSPTSAFMFVGMGLPANITTNVHLWLTGGNLGERDFTVTTDENGTFQLYVWPEEVGAPFFPAGQYRVALSQFGLVTTFWVREQPGYSGIDVAGPVVAGSSAPVHFYQYRPNRVIWGTIAGRDGKVGSQFLVGPSDAAGTVDISLSVPDLGPGPYYIGTPYDYGETSFAVLQPTATATPTATPTATEKPKPTPTKASAKKKCKRKKGKKRCKV